MKSDVEGLLPQACPFSSGSTFLQDDMAEIHSSDDEVTVIEARPSDIDSLTTIVPRSFHPANPYIKETLPDTARLREWWSRVFSDESKDPTCHVLVAIDPDTDKDIGVLTLRLLGPHDKGVGFWTSPSHLWPPDINHEMCKAMIDSMVENRERLMMGKSHYLIELFGAEHGWKGKGVGTKLLRRACEIADGEGVDVFVQANGSAKGFYERLGFECEGSVVMPGDEGYAEFMMVRRFG